MPRFLDEHLTRHLYAAADPTRTYGRRWHTEGTFARRADALTARGVAGHVAVIGAGFGYLLEELLDRGITGYAIEPGEWFWDPENSDEWAPRARELTIRSWVGSGDTFPPADWVIDEDAAPMHTDTELPTFIAGCDAIAHNTIHLVTPLRRHPLGDSALNWKPLTSWQATAPHHWWLDAGTLEDA